MSRRRLILLGLLVALLLPVVALGIQVQMARTAPRLDDEEGFRPDGLAVRRGASPTHVVWVGDSTATGVGSPDVETTMAYLTTEAVVSGPADLTVLAEAGAQVHEVLDGQLTELDALVDDHGPPAMVFVSVGANDVTSLTRRPTFHERYDRLVAQLRRRSPDTTIVAVGVPDLGVAPRLPQPLRQLAGVRAAQLSEEIADVADVWNVVYVDLGERTNQRFSNDPDRTFSADEYHPSAAGHAIWADAVATALRQAGVRAGGDGDDG